MSDLTKSLRIYLVGYFEERGFDKLYPQVALPEHVITMYCPDSNRTIFLADLIKGIDEIYDQYMEKL